VSKKKNNDWNGGFGGHTGRKKGTLMPKRGGGGCGRAPIKGGGRVLGLDKAQSGNRTRQKAGTSSLEGRDQNLSRCNQESFAEIRGGKHKRAGEDGGQTPASIHSSTQVDFTSRRVKRVWQGRHGFVIKKKPGTYGSHGVGTRWILEYERKDKKNEE